MGQFFNMSASDATGMFSSMSALLLTRHSDDDDYPSTPVPHTTVVLHIFFALQLFSLAGISIILFTTAITRTWKHPTWINFCVTWIISCISYSLLVGRPLSYVPPHQLCLAQAALIYTVPSLTASATLALVLHVFRMVRRCGENAGQVLTIALVLFPYLTASGMMAMSLVIGLRDPETVRRTPSGLYCNMGNDTPGKISAGVVTIFMIISLFVEALISWDVKRQWSILRASASSRNSVARSRSAASRNANPRSSGHSGNSRTGGSHDEEENATDRKGLIALALKVFVFSIFSVFAVVLGIVFTFTPHQSPALNIVLALMPAAAVFVFGAQRDLIEAWASGLRRIRDFIIRPIVKHSPSATARRRRHWLRRCHASTDSQEKMIPGHGHGHRSREGHVQLESPISPLEEC